MPRRAQPSDDSHEVWLRHGCATRRRAIHSAANMKKNSAACTGDWRVGIMPDLDEPVIREIARAHFLMRVIIRRVVGIDDDVPVVVR